MEKAVKEERVRKLAQAALFAALAYIGFQFFRIDIPVGGDKTAFHLGNTFVVLGALFLGNPWGGLAGAAGLTIADLTSGYATSAPKTFFLKLMIGLIAGLVAHKVFHLDQETDGKKRLWITLLASVCALSFNVVADLLVGYFYKQYILGQPQDIAKALAKISAVTTFVNAVASTVCAVVFYNALYPALKRSHLLVGSEEKA